MSRCKQCNVEILDETERCPLCRSVLEKTVEVENMYPNVLTRRLALLSRIYLFVAILVEALLIYLNVLSDSEMFWSAIPGLAMLYGYLVLRYAILGKSGYKGKIIVLTLIAILMVVAIDFVVGYRGWSVNYALPSAILLVDAGILILMCINRRNWQLHDVADFYDCLQRCPAGLVCGGERDGAASCLAGVCIFCGAVFGHADHRRPEGKDGTAAKISCPLTRLFCCPAAQLFSDSGIEQRYSE